MRLGSVDMSKVDYFMREDYRAKNRFASKTRPISSYKNSKIMLPTFSSGVKTKPTILLANKLGMKTNPVSPSRNTNLDSKSRRSKPADFTDLSEALKLRL